MDKISFRPIRGLESKIVSQDIRDGYIYFATDSGKIFVDTQNERHTLGGSGAAILYSTSDILANTDDTYTILYSELNDSNAIPKEGDLIINSDGRFFRVNYGDPASGVINCDLIAVSGTGGGGGSSDGSPDASDPKAIDVTYHDLVYSYLYGDDYSIDLTAISKVDKILNISYNVKNASNKVIDYDSYQITSGQRVSLKVGRRITPEGGYHQVNITIQGANSKTYSKPINKIRSVNLKVENDTSNFTSQKVWTGTVQYYVKVFGQIEKTLYVTVDDTKLDPIFLSDTVDNSSQYVNIDCSKLNLSAGVHTINAWVEANGIPSNIAATDFIYHPPGTPDDVYVIITDYPTKCLSYESPIIKYWVWDTAATEGHSNEINLRINDVTVDIATEIQKIGETLLWPITNLTPDAYNTCEIKCGNSSRAVNIYCTKSEIFDPTTDAALLMLDTNGRSNNTSLERRLQWEYKNDLNNTIKANLKDFNWYNNGWKIDANNRTCLRVTNGAKVEIPITVFEREKPNTGGYTFEFEFKPYNLYSYNLLTQTTTTIEKDDNELDDEVVIERTFDASKAIIKYTALDSTGADFGLCCGTQDAFLRLSDGTNISVRYMDEETVTIAAVINAATQQIFLYVNGVMSGMCQYKLDEGKMPIYANILEINSDQCDLDLYSIRVYNKPLSSQEISQNFIANKKDLVLYEENSFASSDKILLSDLITYNTDNPGNATIPYIVFKTKDAPDVLPFNKANADIKVDIDFVNPALDYALAIGEIDEDYYIKHAPSFTVEDVSLNVQGTSSQKYPRKNFKGKFKKAKNWKCSNETIENNSLSKFYITDTMAEKTFTWKADYMESSSCHNTGFASYAQDLYWNHPLDYYFNTSVGVGTTDLGTYRKKYRTTLYGFPVLAFHQKSDGTSEFIGQYNFNLDKSAPTTLGMELDIEHPYLPGQKIADVCECWEFANNMGGRCSFRGNPFDYEYNYDEEKYNLYDADGNLIEGEGKSDIGDDLEVRYHKDKDAIEGAFDNLDAPKDDGGKPLAGGSKEAFEILIGQKDETTGMRTGAYRHLEVLFDWLKDCYYAFDLNTAEDREWVAELLGRESVTYSDLYNENGTVKDSEYSALLAARKQKFGTEFDKHLNLEYCLIYYIMTELLLQYDSRGKNMMLSSWGPVENGGHYIWFPIYYDIDTQLGVNNSGVPSWEYNVEPTTGFNNPGGGKAFSTANSLLWNNFHKYFVEESSVVRNRYQVLRGRTLTINKLNGYYNFDYNISREYCMKGIRPINVINANQYYKYISPSIDGYVNGINDDGSLKMRTTSAYFYCLQGTRALNRALFLRNRFNYYDSKWMAQDYQPGTGGSSIRWRGNAHDDIDDTLDGNLILNIRPALDQYLVLWLDESATYVYPVFVRGGQVASIDLTTFMTSSEYQQQLIYIGGYHYLQEFGNVSLLYVDEFEYPDDATKIIKIEMGNSNPNYNPNVNYKIDAIEEATKNKPLLKVFDISNIDLITEKINLVDSIKLEEFKAIGTNITGATFADGANLKIVHLPNTVTSLAFTETNNLKRILYSESDLTYVEGGETYATEGLYIKDLIKNDGSTNIGELNFVGNNFGLYSFNLLEVLTNARKGKNQTLAMNLEDVHWSPYTLLGEGAIYEPSKSSKYYYANNSFSFEPYSGAKHGDWNQCILNERIYYLNDVPNDVEMATNLDLLDTFIENNTLFTNITDTAQKSYPIITGELYINNTNSAVSEADLANHYNTYFPDLTIRAKNVTEAYRARFVRIDGGAEKEILVNRYDSASATITPPSNETIPAPTHYDFKGWTTSSNFNPSTDVLINDFSAYTFSAAKKEYTFYAVYEKHKYNIEFLDSATGFRAVKNIEYGQVLSEPTEVPFRSDSALPDDQRYTFKGWTNIPEMGGIVNAGTALNAVVDLSTYVSNKNYTFYAVFVQEEVWEAPTDLKYFTFSPYQYEDLYDSTYNKEGVLIAINAEYANKLKGKITLPLQDGSGNPVIGVAQDGFNHNKACGITHIYFEKGDNQYRIFRQQSFEGSLDISKNYCLKYIDIPALINLRYIASYTFRYAMYLENENFENTALTYIGEQAFNGGTSIKASKARDYVLPSTLRVLNAGSFSFNDIRLNSITIGKEGAPCQLQVGSAQRGQYPFVNQNTGYHLLNLKIYVESSDAKSNLEIEIAQYNAFVIAAGDDVYNEQGGLAGQITGKYEVIVA